MFTLPRECVLPVPQTAPQQGALPVCALVTPGLVGSTKLMSHCHAWVSINKTVLRTMRLAGCLANRVRAVIGNHLHH